jgi:hypothetical protein
MITGETPDGLEYLDFDFYRWAFMYDPEDKKMIQWALHTGNLFVGLVKLKALGKHFLLLFAEGSKRLLHCPVYGPTCHDAIKEHIGSFDENLILQIAPDEVERTSAQESLPDGILMHRDLEEPDKQDAVGARGFDPLIPAEVILPHREGDMIAAEVIGRKHNVNGNLVGRAHKNPLLDSRVYKVEFLDSEHQQVSYNLLAEHLLSQIDE